jgi:hypothetical protein
MTYNQKPCQGKNNKENVSRFRLKLDPVSQMKTKKAERHTVTKVTEWSGNRKVTLQLRGYG